MPGCIRYLWMNNRKKGSHKRHAKTSAALFSVVIHAVLIVAAVSFVAVRVYVKDDQTFEQVKVKRPRVKLKKLEVPVTVKKKQPKPKLRKTIVVKREVKTMDFMMPEITGIKGGTGYLDGDGGLGSLGFGLDIDLFGGGKGSGNELEGTFFDLKMNPDGSPRTMNDGAYKDALKNFIGSWNPSRLEKKFFKAPNENSPQQAAGYLISYQIAATALIYT